jgi:hypothetical protein
MPETINWSVTFDAVLGPRVAGSGTQVLDAYDKLSVELAAGAANVDVDTQPSATAGEVKLMVVTAGRYDVGVTISADSGTTTALLDGPLVLIGAGAVSLLADPPQTLQFDNPHTDPVEVDILVGRQA